MTPSRAEAHTRSLLLEPDLAEVSRAREFLKQVATEACFLPERIFDLMVASSEAIANAIEHSGAKEQVEVTTSLRPDRLEVQIEGPGQFHAPSSAQERSHRGLGLPLMACLADHLALYSSPKGGTLVSLTFYREGSQQEEQEEPLPPSVREVIEENELILAITENAPVGIYVLGPDLRYRWANRAYRAFLDEPYRSQDITGLHIGDVVPGAAEAGLLDDLKEVSRSGYPIIKEDQELSGYARGPTWWRRSIVPLIEEKDRPPYELLVVVSEETERKQVEEALRKSEAQVRRKLESVLSPEGTLEDLELADLIDAPAVQSFLDDFHELSAVPLAIIDLEGRVLVGAGWSDLCTQFHRVNPESCGHCIESDIQLSAGVPEGEFKLYKCKNNMWDLATPIYMGGRHMGNIFSGQFFFEGETLDYELFRSQARRYGFDEEEYIRALEAVPRLSRVTVDTAMAFFAKLAQMLSQFSYSTIKLSRSLSERAALAASLRAAHDELVADAKILQAREEELQQQNKQLRSQAEELSSANERTAWSEDRLNRAQEIAHLGSWELDLTSNELSWSDEVYRIFGLAPREFGATYEAFLEHVHPDDRAAVHDAYLGSLREGRDTYEIEHRVIRASTGEIRWVQEKCLHNRDANGQIIRSLGMVLDITDRKQADQALRESEKKYRALAKEKERLYRQQLSIAENLQLALLNVPSELGRVRLGHLYRSATETAKVGGDFYDVFTVRDGRVAVLIGDVAGHGIEAARVAALTKDVIHAFAHQTRRPHEALKRTNKLLLEKSLPGFVTVFLAVLDPESGTLHYSSAGHPETLLRRREGEIQALGAGSSPLGIFPEASWKMGETQLEFGDLLLLYTDGIIDARRDGDFFGEKRLQALLKRRVSVERLPRLIVDKVLAFSGGVLQDDVAVLTVSITADGPAARPEKTAFRQEKLLG